MLSQVDRPFVISGFYTGVDSARYRIFQLHQSYLRVSGGDPVYVYCTGGELPQHQRVQGLHYMTSSLPASNPISSLAEMARCAAELAASCDRAWFVSTHADIWGSSTDWALQLILTGLAAAPDCDVIGFRYGQRGMVARLFAARPHVALRLFDPDHATRYFETAGAAQIHDVSNGARSAAPLYEAYLLDQVHTLGLGSKLLLMPSRPVLKKATQGSRARTFVPADPLFTHDHAHDYGLIRRRWRPHPAPT